MAYPGVSWMDDALCVTHNHPDGWFPEKGTAWPVSKKICERCPVLDECESYRERTDSRHGIWGGETARTQRLRKNRKAS